MSIADYFLETGGRERSRCKCKKHCRGIVPPFVDILETVHFIYERLEMPDKIKSVVNLTSFSNGRLRPSAIHCE